MRMHHLSHGLHVLDRRIRENAMTEVEEMTGPVSSALQDIIHPACDLRQRREQRHRIEIPLNTHVVADAAPGRGHLALQGTDGYQILRLEDVNVMRVLQAVEARTGITIERPRSNDRN